MVIEIRRPRDNFQILAGCHQFPRCCQISAQFQVSMGGLKTAGSQLRFGVTRCLVHETHNLGRSRLFRQHGVSSLNFPLKDDGTDSAIPPTRLYAPGTDGLDSIGFLNTHDGVGDHPRVLVPGAQATKIGLKNRINFCLRSTIGRIVDTFHIDYEPHQVPLMRGFQRFPGDAWSSGWGSKKLSQISPSLVRSRCRELG